MASERFEMRMETELLDRLDRWRAEEEDTPSRAEAIRRLMEAGLAHDNKGKSPQLTDGEKLLTVMLAELTEKLGIETDTDTGFVQRAIYGGHYWALGWQMPGIFHGHADKQARVRFVVDVLDMWSFLQVAHGKLGDEGKARVEAEAAPFGKHVTFRGFDGNNESEYLGIAQFLTRDMGRFSMFKDAELNSHAPTLERYAAMYRVFEPIRATLIGREMSADEIIAVLNARRGG